MKTKKYLSVVIILTMLLVLVTATSVSAAAVKQDICHIDKDSGVFFLINISENAFQAHLDHGDVAPGGLVTDMPGFKFAADCTPIPVMDVTGTWLGRSGLVNNLAYNFTMVLVQAPDRTVTGTIYYSGYAPRSITGSVSGFEFTFTQTGVGYSATVTGDVSGLYYHGYGTDSNSANVELEATKQ